MSTGEGILWATIILLISAGIYFISKKGKWVLFGKSIGVVTLIVAAIVGGIIAYNNYQDRPQPQTSLYGIKLEMSPVEVKLALGEPTYQGTTTNEKTGLVDMVFLYKDRFGDLSKYIRFANNDGDVYGATIVCDESLGESLFNIYPWTTYDEVINKLGTPSKESIRADGLARIITFDKLNVAVEFEKNQAISYCLTDSEGITFTDEYSHSTAE